MTHLFKTGDKVTHAYYGEGVIEALVPDSGEDPRYEVRCGRDLCSIPQFYLTRV